MKHVVLIVGLNTSVFTCSVFTGSAFVEVSGFCCVDEVEELEELEVELCELPPPPLYPPHDDEELELGFSFQIA